MSKILANQIANYGDNSPVEVKEGVNIPAGKPLQADGVSGSNGQILSSTGSSIEWIDNFSGSYNDLTNRPTIPNPQVQSDWNASSGIGSILNKPIIPPQPTVSIANASGSGGLSYNQTNGNFTFTPADLSPYALTTALANSNNWDTAYSWGDHAQAGYATAARETEWDAAYSWGDHALVGYLTAEADTLQTVTLRGATTSTKIIANGGIRADIVGVGGGTGDGDVILTHNDGTSNSGLTHTNTSGSFTISSVSDLNIVGGSDLTTNGEVVISNGAQGERLKTSSTGIDITGDLSVSGTTDIPVGSLGDVDLTIAPVDGQVLKWNATSSSWKPANDLQGNQETGIAFTDLSVTVLPTGTANLTYNDANGVFTYTPPDLSSYLTTETDPVFSASVASGIIQQNVNNWNDAHGWGNHATAGYATTTQLNTALANSSDWDTAYGWGDHSTAGYLTSYTETDTLSDVTARGSTTADTIETGGLKLADNNKINFGTGDDFELYFNSSNLILQNALTSPNSDFYLNTDSLIIGNPTGTSRAALFDGDAQTEIYYSGQKKFETTSTGATVSGDLNFTGNIYQNGVLFTGGVANVTISDTAPGSATAGDLWWESDKGRLKIYYNDTDSSQWVDASPPLSSPNYPVAVGCIDMDGTSPTWSGTTGYVVSGAQPGGAGTDYVYTLTFPSAYAARTDYIVQATYDGTNYISSNSCELAVARGTASVVFTPRRLDGQPLNQGEIMVTITNL